MHKIIGGEFKISLEPELAVSDFSDQLFSSGRSAFSAILKKEPLCIQGRVLLPDYLCSSITRVIIDIGVEYSFYHIKDTLLPDESGLLAKLEKPAVILLISYFGVTSLKEIAKLVKKKSPESIIIIDDVQNYYGTEYEAFADYRFTSYRKWFAVPDGATVHSKTAELRPPVKKNSFAQYKFAGNILKNYGGWIDDELTLFLLKQGESLLESEYDVACSDITKSLIPSIPHEQIKERRAENASYLHTELTRLGIKHLYDKKSVPLFVPVFLDGRTRVRSKMFSENIFTPVHWPYETERLNGPERNELYDTELSLICDQRYSLEDMEKQIEVLKKCM